MTTNAKKLVLYLGLAILLVAAPFVIDATLGRTWVRIVDVALLFIMLALGLNIVVGYAGLLDLGYIAFFAVGAYAYALLASPQFAVHWPFLLLLPLAAVVAAFFGVLLGAPTLRLRGDYLAIVTLGFGEIIRICLNNLNRPYNITNGPQGITLIDPLQLGSLSLAKTHTVAGLTIAPVHSYYFVFLACALASIFISTRLEDSRIGRAWVAIREDELAAAAMGVPTIRMKLWAFATGAAIASVSGVIYATQISFINPDLAKLLHPQWGSITVLAMVVLGGMGGIWGPIVGAIAVIGLPEVFRPLGDARFLVFGLALILIMILRPQGLGPSRRRAAELRGEAHEESLFDVQEAG